MMEFDDRLGYLLLGCFIGFALGYIVRSLRNIKDEVHEVDETVKQIKNERGAITTKTIKPVALFLVVAMTVLAAFSSQSASNKVEKTQNELARISLCNQQFLSKTIVALNERTEYSAQTTAANVSLQTAQATFLQALLVKPPPTDQQRADALADYVVTLTDFLTVNNKSRAKVLNNPYPTNEELMTCLEKGSMEKEKQDE